MLRSRVHCFVPNCFSYLNQMLQLLFEGWRRSLFLWKACRQQRWLNKVRTCNTARPRDTEPFVQLGSYSTSLQLTIMRWPKASDSSVCSLSVWLSAVETNCRTRAALALAGFQPYLYISTCAVCIFATTTIWRWCYIALGFRLCG